jgi:phage terminase large subunit
MNINVEDKIIRSSFKPRPYQEPIVDLILNQGCKRLIVVLPRRAGKDITLWNIAIDWCLRKPCIVYYVGANYASVRKFIWDAISTEGKRFLDYIPERLILKKNEAEQKIIFVNNSILQCVSGEAHATSIRGTNPSMVILSEFAYYEDPTVLDTVSPILAANNGVLIIASTPQGKNSFYQLYQQAKTWPDWFTYFKTVEDTQHISAEALESEKRRMSPEMFLQEFFCDFNRGIDGTIFGKALQNAKRDGHLTHVSFNPGLLVHISIDIGLSKGNATTIIWFQIVGDGQMINIIDCYSSENLGLDFYAALLQERQQKYGYKMGIYLAPHDLAVREWGAGAVTRYEKARQLDITFTTLDQHLLADQIENTLTYFPKVWIDETKCKSLIDALENYYREWDEQRQVYKPKPVHNWASNYASAFMGIFLGLHHCQTTKSADEYDRIRQEALYGKNHGLPRVFRDSLRNQGF